MFRHWFTLHVETFKFVIHVQEQTAFTRTKESCAVNFCDCSLFDFKILINKEISLIHNTKLDKKNENMGIKLKIS